MLTKSNVVIMTDHDSLLVAGAVGAIQSGHYFGLQAVKRNSNSNTRITAITLTVVCTTTTNRFSRHDTMTSSRGV